jgi:hypothetical protein
MANTTTHAAAHTALAKLAAAHQCTEFLAEYLAACNGCPVRAYAMLMADALEAS